MKKLGTKKTVNKNTKLDIENLESELKEVKDKIAYYQEKGKEICHKLMQAKYSPYKEGDTVTIKTSDSKKLKGVIHFDPEIHLYFPVFYPIKKDGTVSQKYRFITDVSFIVGGE